MPLTLADKMSTEPVQSGRGESLEFPVEELLRRARPLPPHEKMLIDDLTEEEGAGFLATLEAWAPNHSAAPIVIDTDVFGAILVPGSKLAATFEPIIVGRPLFISFQRAAELRYGALKRGWGPTRMLKLEARINEAETSIVSPPWHPPIRS
jgi:hypothetical protein